jgi:hypothetical protein
VDCVITKGCNATGPIMPIVATKTLKTRALDNRGKSHMVKLVMRNDASGISSHPEPDRATYRWTLSIEGTPGSWNISTLLGADGDDWNGRSVRVLQKEIIIDFGQRWVCSNLDEIMREALRLI